MALIKCEDCGKEHSDQAEVCPNCGRPSFAKKQKLDKEIADAKEKEEIKKINAGTDKGCAIGCLGFIAFIVLGVIWGNLFPEKKEPYYELNGYDLCVREKKSKGLSTDYCWDNYEKLIEEGYK